MQRIAPDRLVEFVSRLDATLRRYAPFDKAAPAPAMLEEASHELAWLVSEDDWLPDIDRRPSPERYQQYLLYLDPAGRFSVVSFVWGQGQKTPIHDHQVWGLVGVLQGAENCQNYSASGDSVKPSAPMRRMGPGDIEILSPMAGDIHHVENALTDRPTVTIQVYGADIGKVERWVYAPTAPRKRFVSGYSNGPDNPPFQLPAA